MSEVFGAQAGRGQRLERSAMREVMADALEKEVAGERVLLVVPDRTRRLPLADVVSAAAEALHLAASLEVIVALGTHPPIEPEQLDALIGKESLSRPLRVTNHAWDDPGELCTIGTISEEQMRLIAAGVWHPTLGGATPVRINRAAVEADRVVILGPTLPHEVAGFSGGAKYLFPGIGGPEMINVMHWLGALSGVMSTIGVERTPVRSLIDEAASLLPSAVSLVAVVTEGEHVAGMFAGDLHEAWRASVEMASLLHIVWLDRPYERAISCPLPVYDELWTAGKAVYKLEPAIADGGELVVCAPGLGTVSRTHGASIYEVGYHVLPYFLEQAHRFRSVPLAVLAHSTHVKGAGTFAGGVEQPRIRVTLATAISAADCTRLNLGYVDPKSLHVRMPDGISEDHYEDDGVLVVPRSGEMLYRVRCAG